MLISVVTLSERLKPSFSQRRGERGRLVRFKWSLISIIYKVVSSFCQTCIETRTGKSAESFLSAEVDLFRIISRGYLGDSRDQQIISIISHQHWNVKSEQSEQRSSPATQDVGLVRLVVSLMQQRRQNALQSADQLSLSLKHLDINNFIKTSCHPPP